MSRAEGYTLDLYCDGGNAAAHGYRPFPHQFYGQNQRQVYADARAAGWFLSPDEKGDLCPTCAEAAIQARKPK